MTDTQKTELAKAIADLVRRMINDDDTDLNQVSGGVLYNPYEDEFDYEPTATYRDPWQITDSDGILAFLDGAGDEGIRWAIKNPDDVGRDFVDCYAYGITERIDEIKAEFKD